MRYSQSSSASKVGRVLNTDWTLGVKEESAGPQEKQIVARTQTTTLSRNISEIAPRKVPTKES